MYTNNLQSRVWRQTSDPGSAASEYDVWVQTDGSNNPLTTSYRLGGVWTNTPIVALPTGSVSAFAGSSVPSGYLVCQGQAVSRTTYSSLFSVIGSTYGSGDGSTTFNLPDLRAEFIRGLDAGRGVDTARALGSSQGYATAAPQNTNPDRVTGGAPAVLGSQPSAIGFARAALNGAYNNIGDDNGVEGNMDVQNVVTGDAETRPRNIAMNYIIKT